MRNSHPGLSDKEIAQFILNARLAVSGLKSEQIAFVEEVRDVVTDIYSLCHLIAKIELLNHLSLHQQTNLTVKGENIVEHTYNVMNDELEKLGY